MNTFEQNRYKSYFIPENIFLICSLVFGLAFIILTPPLQAPDGGAHFLRAWQVSYGNFYHGSTQAKIRFSFPDYWFQLKNIAGNSNKKLYWDDLKAHIFSDTSSNKKPQLTTATANSFVYHPISYLCSGAGIALARLSNLPWLLQFYIGRIMNLLAWTFLTWAGLRIIPFFKWESTFIVLLPMSLFMGASISADSFNNAVCFLLICILLKSLFDSEKTLSYKTLTIITASAFAVACGKQIYALLFYLILFAYKKFISTRFFWYYLLGSTILIMVGCSWVLFNTTPSSIDSKAAFQQLTQTLSTPFKVLISTLAYHHLEYFKQFIGVLGSLDTQASQIIYLMYQIVLILLFSVMCISKSKIQWSLRFTAAALIILYICTIIFSLYLLWPNYSPLVCEGVQGRYFIPFSLLLPVVFAKYSPLKKGRLKQTIFNFLIFIQGPARLLLVIATIIGLTSYCFALSSRYYHDKHTELPETAFVQSIANRHYHEIVKGRTINQEFIAISPHLKKIELLLGTYSRTNTGLLKLEIIDPKTGRIITVAKHDMKNVADNRWHPFYFHHVKLTPEKKYIIRLSAPNASKGNAVTWFGSKRDVYSHIKANINGEPVPVDMAFAITYAQP